MDQVALIGSSLGGFYATQLVAKYQIPAVLINPAMRPWQLFRQLFSDQTLPYTVCETWTLDEQQLTEMEKSRYLWCKLLTKYSCCYNKVTKFWIIGKQNAIIVSQRIHP